ncbi:unnamed protein product, partial [marine sediment metagenome]
TLVESWPKCSMLPVIPREKINGKKVTEKKSKKRFF